MIAAAGSARAAATANAAVLRTCSHVSIRSPRTRRYRDLLSDPPLSKSDGYPVSRRSAASRTASRITMQGGPQMGQSSVWRLSRSPYRFWEH
jgi:hypothetical protein